MPVLLSYRNQSIDLLCNSLDSFYMRATLAFNPFMTEAVIIYKPVFLYDNGLRHERVNGVRQT